MWYRALMVALVACFSLAAGAQDAITVTESGGQVAILTYSWTSDGSGNATGRTTAAVPGILFSCGTGPGAGDDQPTDNYDIVVYQAFDAVGGGVNVLTGSDKAAGALADRDDTASESVDFWPSVVTPVAGYIEIRISNAGAANTGRIDLAIARNLAIQTTELSLVGGSAGQILQYSAPGIPQYVTMSGDATIAAGGAVTITGGAGTGTVTSVAVSGSDGLEVDSGSPVTSSGTIALGVNKTTMLSFLNVADGADVAPVTSVNTLTGVVVLDPDDLDDSATTNKFVTASDVTNLGNLSGTNTGDQTITLTGDVTGTGTGSFATTIGAAAVANSMLENMAQSTLKGRAAAAGTGVPGDLSWLQVRTLLRPTSTVTSSAAAVAWNSDNALFFKHTMTENTTVSASSGTPAVDQLAVFEFTQGAGPWTAAWNAEFDPGTATGTWSGTVPALSTTSGDVDRYIWKYDGTNFQLLAHVTN